MANPTEPATSPIFRALRSVDVDPDLAYEAAEASRLQAGENVYRRHWSPNHRVKGRTQGSRSPDRW